MQEFKVQMRCS